MKHILILGVGALLLAGCPTSNKCESGDICDSGGGGGGGGAIELENLEGDCSDGDYCYWYADADGPMGFVELDMIETGDDSWECGPSAPGEKDLVCGVWHEFHNDFAYYGENDFGGETFSLALAIEGSWENQVDNYSTLFDMTDAGIYNQITIMMTIYDGSGNWADCAVLGEYPDWYSSDCTNVW